jgi:ABC-type multidrug transport system ATPase subunit
MSSDIAAAYQRRVDDTLELLQLTHCANTLIGNELLRGVSGGEKKRVTVGEGLMTNAQVLLLEYEWSG